MYIPVHEGCGNVVTLKENMEDLHKDYTKIAQRLPKGYPKYFGVNHTKSEYYHQRIK